MRRQRRRREPGSGRSDGTQGRSPLQRVCGRSGRRSSAKPACCAHPVTFHCTTASAFGVSSQLWGTVATPEHTRACSAQPQAPHHPVLVPDAWLFCTAGTSSGCLQTGLAVWGRQAVLRGFLPLGAITVCSAEADCTRGSRCCQLGAGSSPIPGFCKGPAQYCCCRILHPRRGRPSAGPPGTASLQPASGLLDPADNARSLNLLTRGAVRAV